MKGFLSIRIVFKTDVIGWKKYSLQARPWSFQPGNVTGWGSEGVNMKARTMTPRATKKNEVTKQVNMVLNVHRNRKAY